MAVVRKRDVPVQPTPVSNVQASSAFVQRYPSIWEMLSKVAYDDGEPRRTATLTVFVEDGIAKLCINDRDNGLTGWVTGDCPLAAMDVLELQLAEDRVVWRAAGQALKNRKKRI